MSATLRCTPLLVGRCTSTGFVGQCKPARFKVDVGLAERGRFANPKAGTGPRHNDISKPSDVVAELAKYGIEVSAGLVQKVKIELMKDTSGIRRQKAKLALAEPHPKVRAIRKTPARRSQAR